MTEASISPLPSEAGHWYAPDGSQYDDVQSMGALRWAYSALIEEEQLQGAGNTYFQSWAENQELT